MSQVEFFEFKGFKPNLEFIRECQKVCDLVETRSPSESTKEASITKARFGGYQAHLKITSASCVFEISVKEAQPGKLMNQLYKQFSVKIVDWNKTRQTP